MIGNKRGEVIKYRILIIEDDPASGQLVAYLLKAFGHVALLTASGEEGLKAARRERPDLIICDISLPKKTGIEIMRELKADKTLRDIPVIAHTIFTSTGHRERLLAAGFNGYIPKPVRAEDFVAQIEEFLRRALSPRPCTESG